MKKKSKPNSRKAKDDLYVPPVTRQELSRGVMGKYYRQAMAGSNVVRIAPELTEAFPNESSVNHALRELLRFRETLVSMTADKTQKQRRAS